jgi:hypothetical protein
MNLNNKNGSPKIKRRNFFYYLGASAIGIFSLSKLPLNIFKSKINKELTKKQKPVVKSNPYAVKRDTGGTKNG